MRLASFAAALFVTAAAALPAAAQSLEVTEGGALRIEIAHVDATVEEGVANVEVDETFRNGTARVLEGVWKFRLPEEAVIGGFSMWMDGKEKHGRVFEAREARRVYDSIVRKRLDPGIVEQTGWRDFKVSVFPIPANGTVRVRLRYAHVVRDDLGLETLEVPLPTGVGTIGDLSVKVAVKSAAGLTTVDCPSHDDAVVKVDASGALATWSADGKAPAGPFVLRSIPRRDGFAVTMLANRPAGASEGWFVARVVPRLAEPPAIPRDVVFVIDRSGSMEGVKMEQARTALLRGLDTLKPGDRFEVISFSTDVTTHVPGGFVAVSADTLDAARRAANDLTASGGTNIAGALEAALARRTDDPGRLFAVVFLTDGDPTVGERNPDKILAAWRAKSATKARLFAFGVGRDVKDFLLTKLATEGRGDARYVREERNLEVELAALFDRVKTPLLLDPEIEIAGDGVEVRDREPRRLPDLFQSRAFVVSGRYTGAGKATLRLRGSAGTETLRLDVPIEFPAETPARPYVAQIWAKARIERLLDDLRVTGTIVPEIREDVTRLGVRHQLVTPYTSYLVVEDGVRLPDGSIAGGEPALPKSDESAGPVDPDEVIIPRAAAGRRGEVSDAGDLDPGPFNPDPDLPSGATGGTSLGVGGGGGAGSGAPSAFASRRAGAGGRGGGGLGQGGGGGPGGSTKATESSVLWGLRWLEQHQSADGHWSSDAYDAACKLNRCGGAGAAGGDVGVTGLSLLAFLAAGETHQAGTSRDAVKNALKWLRDVQDGEGCLGPRTAPDALRQHAMAALALTEAYGMTGSRVFKEPATRAIAFALSARRPGKGWGKSGAADAQIDPETTGWMVMLLHSARLSGLDVEPDAVKDALAELDAATDKTTGATAAGPSGPSVAVLFGILAGGSAANDPLYELGVNALAAQTPKWDTADAASWHFGTLAMFQLGGERWKRWNEAMKTVLLNRQRMEADRDERGSWDPIGVGAAAGGRVTSTALMTLDLEVYYRYARFR